MSWVEDAEPPFLVDLGPDEYENFGFYVRTASARDQLTDAIVPVDDPLTTALVLDSFLDLDDPEAYDPENDLVAYDPMDDPEAYDLENGSEAYDPKDDLGAYDLENDPASCDPKNDWIGLDS